MDCFLVSHSTWLGLKVFIYEPSCIRSMYGVPIIKINSPLIPIDDSEQKSEVTIPLCIADCTVSIKPINIIVPKIKFIRICMVEACGSALCDNGHALDQKCPGLRTSLPNLAIKGILSFDYENEQYKFEYQSDRFSRLFFEKESFFVDHEQSVVRYVYRRGVVAYTDEKIPFQIGGYVRFSPMRTKQRNFPWTKFI